jgi:hypothetical protein
MLEDIRLELGLGKSSRFGREFYKLNAIFLDDLPDFEICFLDRSFVLRSRNLETGQ